MDAITITPGQMVALGKLVSNAILCEPHDGNTVGRWEIVQVGDGDIRVRDIEQDFYISPGGQIF